METEQTKDVIVNAPYETALTVARDPNAVLAEAQRAAKALKSVIDMKVKKVIFNDEQYLEYEDWSTIARFYGVSAKVSSTEYVETGNVKGYSARAVAIQMSTGIEVSAAESMCLNDEPNWSTRKGIPVPMFQLKSMAQTRACAKALRNVLSWVVVLAGFKPTPAEEMTGKEGQASHEAPPAGPKAAEPTQKQGCISEPQSKRFFAIWKNAGKDPGLVDSKLMETIGSKFSKDIPLEKYDELCRWAASKTGVTEATS